MSMLQDESGMQSSKRWIAFICSMCLCATLILSAVSSRYIDPSPQLVYAITTVICVCIGATSFDKQLKGILKAKSKGEPSDAK